MNRVVTAIESGRCVFAVSGSLLNDADVVLALKERAHGVAAIALSGTAPAPITPVTEGALLRATAQPGGVVVIVNPQPADDAGIKLLAGHLAKGAHKPTVLVAAQSFNPLQFMTLFKGVAVAHLKARGKDFFKGLPLPPASAAPEAEKALKPKGDGDLAPRFVFVGREEEQATLVEMLQSGGPIVVSGSAGVGKTLLTEHAVAQSGLTRLPDLVLGWGTGADTLFARLAEICRAAGAPGLYDLLKGGAYQPVQAVREAIASLQAATGTEGQVFVIHDLHHAMGRDDGFWRRSRLEALLMAMLTSTYPLRVVFLSRAQPVFHREGAAAGLRRLALTGIKGRFFHEIFDAYKVPEFPRDKFGPIAEKVHGHPMVARAYAIEVRDRDKGLELLDSEKFLRMEDVNDLQSYKRLIEKKVERLAEDERRALALAAHFRLPVTGQILTEAGIGRKQRLQLLADGLLETVGTEKERKFVVHSLVRSALSLRETSEFDILANLASGYGKLSQGAADPLAKLALAQEANRNAITGRATSLRIALDLPDDDAVLESATGLIRSQKPHFEMAAQRLNEVLNRNPANADAHLLKLELLEKSNASKDALQHAIDEAVTKASVAEVFQQVTGLYTFRKAKAKATAVLEQGIELLPDEARLRTRLAALLMRQGRRKEAIEHLKAAMALEPMLPDSYGLLGTARRDEGVEALDEAENLLREAVRLAPGDTTQICRLADLQMARARVQLDRQAILRAEAKDLLEQAIKGEHRTADAHLLLARLVREEGGDLERATWLVKKAKKLTEKSSERNLRIGFEFAMIDLRRGDLDAAERELRVLSEKDPANDRVFAGLAELLEARQQYIPAHAELLRARERTPQNTVEYVFYSEQLARIQAVIEAQVASMVAGDSAPSMSVDEAPAAAGHHRVIRRRKHDESHADEAPASESAEGVEGDAVAARPLYDEADAPEVSEAPEG